MLDENKIKMERAKMHRAARYWYFAYTYTYIRELYRTSIKWGRRKWGGTVCIADVPA